MRKVAKAIYAGVVAFLTGVLAITAGDSGLSDIITNQWIVIALAVVAAVGGVYKITNKPA